MVIFSIIRYFKLYLSILGDRDGNTKYVWPSRVLNVRKDGIPLETENLTSSAKGFRNDDVVGKYQVYGILEPSYKNIIIEGDEMKVSCIGWHGEIYHQFKVKRARAGRIYSSDFESKVFD